MYHHKYTMTSDVYLFFHCYFGLILTFFTGLVCMEVLVGKLWAGCAISHADELGLRRGIEEDDFLLRCNARAIN